MSKDIELQENTGVIEADKSNSKDEHTERVIRTVIACVMGIIAGVISHLVVDGQASPSDIGGILGLLFFIGAVVFQKQVMFFLKIDHTELSGKDWFYQAFMTGTLWFITWTFLLTYPLTISA